MLTKQVRSLLPSRCCRLCGIQATTEADCLNCPDNTARPPGTLPDAVSTSASLPSNLAAPPGQLLGAKRCCRLCGAKGTSEADCLACLEDTARPPGLPGAVSASASLPGPLAAPSLGQPLAAGITKTKSRSGRRRALRRAALLETKALDLT